MSYSWRNLSQANLLNKLMFPLSIYTFQIDFMKHVSNIVYVQWMEIARTRLLEAIEMPVHAIAQQGFGPVLVESHITYKKPLVLGDTVRVETWLSELSHLSAWLEYRFYNGRDELAASGRQRGIFIDLASGKPRRLQSEERELFQRYLIEADTNPKR
jgi:acyl-CoA thioester hydrolase